MAFDAEKLAMEEAQKAEYAAIRNELAEKLAKERENDTLEKIYKDAEKHPCEYWPILGGLGSGCHMCVWYDKGFPGECHEGQHIDLIERVLKLTGAKK
jgi:hypothetical protein